MKKESLVFDAWAIVAWLNEEPPAPKVRHLLEEAEKGNVEVYMSLVNAGEVFYITAKKEGLLRAKEIIRELLDSPITFVLPSEEQIWKAAEVKARFPLSYADAFAVALGIVVWIAVDGGFVSASVCSALAAHYVTAMPRFMLYAGFYWLGLLGMIGFSGYGMRTCSDQHRRHQPRSGVAHVPGKRLTALQPGE
jgi:predicted nucleic acid-binding protein